MPSHLENLLFNLPPKLHAMRNKITTSGTATATQPTINVTSWCHDLSLSEELNMLLQ